MSASHKPLCPRCRWTEIEIPRQETPLPQRRYSFPVANRPSSLAARRALYTSTVYRQPDGGGMKGVEIGPFLWLSRSPRSRDLLPAASRAQCPAISALVYGPVMAARHGAAQHLDPLAPTEHKQQRSTPASNASATTIKARGIPTSLARVRYAPVSKGDIAKHVILSKSSSVPAFVNRLLSKFRRGS